MCFENLTLTNIKDFVTIITLSIGAYVACIGLQTWKKQLKGSQNYNLAKSMLINLYKYRESLNQVRHPAIWGNEYPKFSPDELINMSPQERSYQEKTHAYENRWSNINQIKPILLENLIESQVLWKQDLSTHFQKLFKLEFQLRTAVIHYLQVIKPHSAKDSLEKSDEDLIWDTLNENDPFRIKINEVIYEIEKHVKLHLN
ncbi:hypothetical protein D7217_11305 [Legionella pneumophila]|uniref:hypothetical protein n=1 Tax=Legionella pneumophila TaxID=446 RepID=UPI00048092C6|nr:hypothetical protein [Legionella pneumophila]RYW89281.1 hypothetical protein D7217_11305 [Legionella pneumophila]STY00407.1 Uncharacterised protein [Legionella pneumophila]HAT1776023.1 hypothetical protein [Legionella pneumophila]HAT1779046.1 hypothetical protein [Legionella pneumophila]HAT2019309.1 hypothetical protein [Legionella pneumophila]